MAFVCMIGLPFVIRYLSMGLVSISAVLGVTMILALYNVFAVRTHVGFASHLSVFTVFALLVVSNIVSGGFYDPNFSWLYVVPLIAVVLVGLRAGLIWTGIIMMTTAVFWFAHAQGAFPSLVPESQHALQSLLNRVSAIFAIGGVAIAYVYEHRMIEGEVRIAKEEIERLAFVDEVTGLANRHRFLSLLNQELQAHERGALLFIDLDRFKDVNDTQGHAVGDLLLREVAFRLEHALSEDDTIARIGGDEFALILPNVTPETVYERASMLLQSMRSPLTLSGESKELITQVDMSIGIALFPDHGTSNSILLRHADTAMYRAKGAGGDRAIVYDDSLGDRLERQNMLQLGLREAIANRDIDVYFQGIVDPHSFRDESVEALARWTYKGERISPVEFIPVAEATGLIVPLGQVILEKACEQAKRWRESGRYAPCVCVNVSAHQFKQRAFVDNVLEVLDFYQLPGTALEIELTESALVDANVVGEAMIRLQKAGITIALDDFGTGYSSLSYMRQFPFDRVKIDQSFIKGLPTSDADKALVTAVITLAHSLGLNVVAEGLETQEHVRLLVERGADALQGYHFARPIPPDEYFTRLSAQRQARKVSNA